MIIIFTLSLQNNFLIRCFKEEQLAFCVRYPKGLTVNERFLGFIDVSESQNAEAIASKIFEFIDSLNLNSVPIIAQAYDGAAVMSGIKNGLQTKIKQKHPEAIYVHCMAHKLNLVVVDTCNYIKVTITFKKHISKIIIKIIQKVFV